MVVSTIFLFSPLFGEDEPILTNIFQMGLVQPPTSLLIILSPRYSDPHAPYKW